MNDLDFPLAHEARQRRRAGDVKGVAQPERDDILWGNGCELVAERRIRSERRVDIVTARGERARQIGQMSFASAKGARRADVKDSHEAWNDLQQLEANSPAVVVAASLNILFSIARELSTEKALPLRFLLVKRSTVRCGRRPATQVLVAVAGVSRASGDSW